MESLLVIFYFLPFVITVLLSFFVLVCFSRPWVPYLVSFTSPTLARAILVTCHEYQFHSLQLAGQGGRKTVSSPNSSASLEITWQVVQPKNESLLAMLKSFSISHFLCSREQGRGVASGCYI